MSDTPDTPISVHDAASTERPVCTIEVSYSRNRSPRYAFRALCLDLGCEPAYGPTPSRAVETYADTLEARIAVKAAQ